MPKCYQLIGVPASGKSTWYKNQSWTQNHAYISTDKWLEHFAREVGQTYSQVFDLFMPVAVSCMMREVEFYRSREMDIVWDQTSTTVGSRRKKFKLLPNYEHIAVIFKTPEITVLRERLDSRPGKTIPWSVVSGMIDQFEIPTEAEGFKEIWYAN